MNEPMKPLTEQALDILQGTGNERLVHAAEGADLLRGLLASGEQGSQGLAQTMTIIIAQDPDLAAPVIGILTQVAVRADKLLKQGIENFEAAPEDLKEKIRAQTSS